MSEQTENSALREPQGMSNQGIVDGVGENGTADQAAVVGTASAETAEPSAGFCLCRGIFSFAYLNL